MAGSLNPMMGFLALMQGNDDMAAQIFSQFGTPQGTQNEFLQLAQGMGQPLPRVPGAPMYDGIGTFTGVPWWAQQGFTSEEQARTAQSVDATIERSRQARTQGTSRPGGGVTLSEIPQAMGVTPSTPPAPRRPSVVAAQEAQAAAAAAAATNAGAEDFAPGPTTDPTVQAAQAAQAEAIAAQLANTPQAAPAAVGKALGGTAMPGMGPLSAEDEFLNSLGAIEAPDSQRPPPPGAVAPSRGTQVQPTLARLLTQMLSMGAGNPPSFRSLMR